MDCGNLFRCKAFLAQKYNLTVSTLKRELFIEFVDQQHLMPVNFGGISDKNSLATHKMINERDSATVNWAGRHSYAVMRVWPNADIDIVLSKLLS